MADLARQFHSENLKRATEQFARGEDVLPLIHFLKDGELFQAERGRQKVEEVLRAIEEEFEPDAVNLTILPSGKVPIFRDGVAFPAPDRVLLSMTFDNLGHRWYSIYQIVKEGDSFRFTDISLEGQRLQFWLRTTPEGDLAILIERA